MKTILLFCISYKQAAPITAYFKLLFRVGACLLFVLLFHSCEQDTKVPAFTVDTSNQEDSVFRRSTTSYKTVLLDSQQEGFYKYLQEIFSAHLQKDTFYFKFASWVHNFAELEGSSIPTVYQDSTAYLKFAVQDSIYLIPYYCWDGREQGVLLIRNSKDTLHHLGGQGWHNLVYLPSRKALLAFSSFWEDTQQQESYVEASILVFNTTSYWKVEKRITTLYLEELEDTNQAVAFYHNLLDSIDFSTTSARLWKQGSFIGN